MATPKPKQAVAAIKLPVRFTFHDDTESVNSIESYQLRDGDNAIFGFVDTEDQARQIAHALNSLPGLVESCRAMVRLYESKWGDEPPELALARKQLAAAEKGMV